MRAQSVSYTQPMATFNKRISDVERHRALEALGVHYTQGRLGLNEYELRSDRAMESEKETDLQSLFLDLPLPHYNKGLAIRSSAQPRVPYVAPIAEPINDPWDAPMGNSPLTYRKMRKIGWVVAISWLFFMGPALSQLLPSFLSGFIPILVFTPMIVMIIAGIALAPNRPKYRVHTDPYGSGRYPY